MFEFGAVLFLVSVFPETLLYTSVYALVRSLAVALLSSWLGARIDRLNRLTTLRLSIVWQRIPVALSCVCFILLLPPSLSAEKGAGSALVPVLFTVVVALACVEKLASVANTVSVERDWVVIIAESLKIPRQDLNASMRRIDLFCKLFAPVFISLIDSFSTKVAIWTVFGLNASWVVIEYVAIAQVYNAVPELARRDPPSSSGEEVPQTNEQHEQVQDSSAIVRYVRNMAAPWRDYVTSPVFLASFALSLLYLTVLSFAPQMITYLLHTGFTSLEVSCMRIGAVASELAGTWAAPVAMRRIGPVRAGLWFINWQFGCLAAAAAGFVFFDSSNAGNASRLVAVSLVVGVALSRVGLWGFDLSVQYLVQEETSPSIRARFSSTEMALQNIFELISFMLTIIFPRPEQFKYPVLISYGAIGTAAISYAAYVRKERGHLVHLSKLCLGGGSDNDKTLFSAFARSWRRNNGYEHLV
ncbi:hypothetical protein VTN77DRAFT_3830 [Rasamsonia byssochlamydoides]|uniref:uncharacterized protein n=1 Tax=Rasamsonia byssochlamydoides TaxID=89139 RepID=UPI0037422AEA